MTLRLAEISASAAGESSTAAPPLATSMTSAKLTGPVPTMTVFMLTMVGHRLARPAPPRRGRPDEGQASPRFSAISRLRTLPSLTRSPSCSHSLVTQARRPLIVAAVRSDSGAGTYMSSW